MNIELGEKLFEFLSKQDWINKANRIWRYHGVTPAGDEPTLARIEED